jgi:hypothetical protein
LSRTGLRERYGNEDFPWAIEMVEWRYRTNLWVLALLISSFNIASGSDWGPGAMVLRDIFAEFVVTKALPKTSTCSKGLQGTPSGRGSFLAYLEIRRCIAKLPPLAI